jgi:type I restriction enzyme M protein
MTADHFAHLDQFGADLWKLADQLRANSGLASNEYFMPILGLLFLRHASNRYYAAREAIAADQAGGSSARCAMEAVEARFPPLAGQLPKDYERFDDDLLESMMRKFDTEALTGTTERREAVGVPLGSGGAGGFS